MDSNTHSASQVQRTPIAPNRTPAVFNQQWPQQSTSMRTQQLRPLRTRSLSENSENEVDNILGQQRHLLKSVNGPMQTGHISSRGPGNQRGNVSCSMPHFCLDRLQFSPHPQPRGAPAASDQPPLVGPVQHQVEIQPNPERDTFDRCCNKIHYRAVGHERLKQKRCVGT